ncbi:MAG: site-specific integrase [Ruminococcaceae bacterium]|nr:site-specific integrase [Oscillospiraceae bacterium]
MPRRGENIYKRKDGRWEARYIKEIALDGTKRYGSVYAKTYREVKAKQLVKINQQSENTKKCAETVGELMSEWLDSSKNRLKISSYRKYQAIVQNHISERLGKLPLKCVTAQIIAQFSDSLLAKHLSMETINQILMVLGMGFKYARERYQVTLPEIRFLKTSKASMRVFSPMEQQVLVKKLLDQNDIYSFGILLTLYTGLRIGEVCALRWEDVSANTIHIQRTMQRLKSDSEKTEIVILPPKTSSSDRIIPIPKILLSVIEQHRKPSGNVLLQENGNIVEPRLLQRKFTKIVAACGLEKANFHALRHTFATRCIEVGVDVKTLSELLGHADVKTTLNKYVHSSFELKQNSMDMLTM